MNKQELIDAIKKEDVIDKDIKFSLIADNEKTEKFTIKAKVYGVEFILWEHQKSLGSFYMVSSPGIEYAKKMSLAMEKLGRALGVKTEKDAPKEEAQPLPKEVTDQIVALTEHATKRNEAALINEGMVQAYENVLKGVQITITK